jgi:hypothetical protein
MIIDYRKFPIIFNFTITIKLRFNKEKVEIVDLIINYHY